jgi:Ser/Thr protein kinase RdoA (MazF antagonist)
MPAANVDEAIKRWGGNATITAKLSGGTRSDVWAVQIEGRPHTLRRSRRPLAAVDWELDLIQFLSSQGVGVPSVLPTTDGSRTYGRFFALSWIEGRPPRTDAEWREVATTLEHVHELTRSWPQRPTFASTVDLLTSWAGGDVNLSLMPRTAVEQCRKAWLPLIGERTSAIHGDPRGNVLITERGVVFIDWDEARVDVSMLDLADLPGEHAPPAVLAVARRAASAWEAAASWSLEPDYARRRLAELASSPT